MDVADFDQLAAEEAGAVVRACADIDSWVDAVVAARPFGSVESLLAFADDAASSWAGTEVKEALADHPRIGERHGGSGVSAELSAREQAAAAGDRDATAAIVAGNQRYEERFGRVFLIRAAGRSGRQILAELTRRLDNGPEEELRETTEQLRQIAALRLKGLFA